MTVCAAWEITYVTWCVAFYKETFDTLNSLEASCVSKPWRTRDVTASVDVRNRCFIAVTYLDEAAIKFHFFASRENRGNSDSNETDISSDSFVTFRAFYINGYRVAVIFKVNALGICEAGYSLLRK